MSLGFALHYIHAFHSRCFFIYLIYIKKIYKKKERKEGKRKHIVVLELFFLFLKTKLVNLFLMMPKSSVGSLIQSGALDNLVGPAK